MSSRHFEPGSQGLIRTYAIIHSKAGRPLDKGTSHSFMKELEPRGDEPHILHGPGESQGSDAGEPLVDEPYDWFPGFPKELMDRLLKPASDALERILKARGDEGLKEILRNRQLPRFPTTS